MGEFVDIVIAIPIAIISIIVLVMVGGMVLTMAVTAAALTIGIVGSILLYLIGIPWSIWFRLSKGRWPEEV